MSRYAASINDVIAASKRIEGHAHRTPVLTNKTIDKLSGRKIFFKCENFQKIGAFKFRGGWNAISSLNEKDILYIHNNYPKYNNVLMPNNVKLNFPIIYSTPTSILYEITAEKN